MSRIIRDCRCGGCDAVTEHWVNTEELASLKCPECGSSEMKAMIGAPKLWYADMCANGEASSDSMTTAIDKWQKRREKQLRIEKREIERHGEQPQ